MEFLSVTTTVNSVPTSFSDSTLIVPFIISTIFFVIAIPRPVLPYLFLVLPSSCENGSNILGRYSLLIPMPVSLIQNVNVDCSSNSAVFSTDKVILPGAFVNLTAFESIFTITSLSFISSPI